MADSQTEPNTTAEGLSAWSCTWRDPVSQPNEQAQVGDLLRMTCQGSTDQHFNETLFFLEKEDAKHLLKVIEVKSSTPGELDLVVASYRPGDHKDLALMLSDGQTFAKINPISFSIQSVLPQDKKPEPFPFYGPFQASYSVWLWVSIALLVALFSYPAVRYFRKRRQKQKLLDATEIQLREQSLLHDMSKFYRQQKKVLEAPEVNLQLVRGEIEKNLKEYLVVRYKVPAFAWSRADVIDDIKKTNKTVAYKISPALSRLMYELSSETKFDLHGVSQLLEQFRKFYEKSEKLIKEVRK